MKGQVVAGTAASGDAAYKMPTGDTAYKMQPNVGRVTSRGEVSERAHRLRRLKEVWINSGCPRYFLTICVQDRHPALANEIIHQRVVAFLRESPSRYGCWPTRYVLMPDHLHLLVSTGPDSISLGGWVKALKAFVGNREFYWQASFFDHVIRSDESETDKWEYIRQNPVRAGLVARAEDWLFAGELSCESQTAASDDAADNP